MYYCRYKFGGYVLIFIMIDITWLSMDDYIMINQNVDIQWILCVRWLHGDYQCVWLISYDYHYDVIFIGLLAEGAAAEGAAGGAPAPATIYIYIYIYIHIHVYRLNEL